MTKITLLASALALTACSHGIDVHHTYDPETQIRWTSVLAPMDAVGGMRQTLLCGSAPEGQITNIKEQCFDASAPGTFEAFMQGGMAGLMQGAGFAGGMSAIRSLSNATVNATINR